MTALFEHDFNPTTIRRVIEGRSITNVLRLARTGVAVAECQQKILMQGCEFDAYLFAKEVPGADIAACQARVLNGNSPQVLRFFAQDVEGADILALQARMLEIGNALDMRIFANRVSNSDPDLLIARAAFLDGSACDRGHHSSGLQNGIACPGNIHTTSN